jgi:ATP-binding cassette, subfamily C (CFTR/MRP), member 1
VAHADCKRIDAHDFCHSQITYRELKRLDSANRSPLYALLGESIDGVPVIRSFGAEPSLMRRLTSYIDSQQHAYFLTCAAQSWLAVRLELIGTLIITFACLSAVLRKEIAGADPTFAGLAGLAISYALMVTQSLNWSVRSASDLEANMVAVERVKEYSMVSCEGARHTTKDEDLPSEWPTHGKVELRNVKMRYRDELPLVLRGLDLIIPAGSKVGVVGRTGESRMRFPVISTTRMTTYKFVLVLTGAGKSTLMTALLRIVEIDEGQILIDGQDIRDVGLEKLRSNIACIPQDPTLYSGKSISSVAFGI